MARIRRQKQNGIWIGHHDSGSGLPTLPPLKTAITPILLPLNNNRGDNDAGSQQHAGDDRQKHREGARHRQISDKERALAHTTLSVRRIGGVGVPAGRALMSIITKSPSRRTR